MISGFRFSLGISFAFMEGTLVSQPLSPTPAPIQNFHATWSTPTMRPLFLALSILFLTGCDSREAESQRLAEETARVQKAMAERQKVEALKGDKERNLEEMDKAIEAERAALDSALAPIMKTEAQNESPVSEYVKLLRRIAGEKVSFIRWYHEGLDSAYVAAIAKGSEYAEALEENKPTDGSDAKKAAERVKAIIAHKNDGEDPERARLTREINSFAEQSGVELARFTQLKNRFSPNFERKEGSTEERLREIAYLNEKLDTFRSERNADCKVLADLLGQSLSDE